MNVNVKDKYSSCKDILADKPGSASGMYAIVERNTNTTINVYCDMTSNGGGWTRLYYKNGPNTCFNDNNVYMLSMAMFSNITMFGVSDKITTMSADQSWILSNLTTSTTQNLNTIGFVNVSNCKTPTNTAWSMSYSTQDNYIYVQGNLSTNGSWTRMYEGCKLYADIGKLIGIRMGGAPRHTGEFIHTSCNDYTVGQNTVTSRWDWNNIRSVWIK